MANDDDYQTASWPYIDMYDVFSVFLNLVFIGGQIAFLHYRIASDENNAADPSAYYSPVKWGFVFSPIMTYLIILMFKYIFVDGQESFIINNTAVNHASLFVAFGKASQHLCVFVFVLLIVLREDGTRVHPWLNIFIPAFVAFSFAPIMYMIAYKRVPRLFVRTEFMFELGQCFVLLLQSVIAYLKADDKLPADVSWIVVFIPTIFLIVVYVVKTLSFDLHTKVTCLNDRTQKMHAAYRVLAKFLLLLLSAVAFLLFIIRLSDKSVYGLALPFGLAYGTVAIIILHLVHLIFLSLDPEEVERFANRKRYQEMEQVGQGGDGL